MERTIHIQYFAMLREQRGCAEERVQTAAPSPSELYLELQNRHALTLPVDSLKVAINGTYSAWDTPLHCGDEVVFIQPVAGG